MFTACHAGPIALSPNWCMSMSTYIDSESEGVALANMTKNPSYTTANEVVSTRFASASEEDQKVDHTYEVLPFEANEEEGEGPVHGSQGNAVDGEQEATAGDV